MTTERRTLGQLDADALKALNDLTIGRQAVDETLKQAFKAHADAVGGLIAAHNAFWQATRVKLPGLPPNLSVDFATGELFDEVEVPGAAA